MFSIRLTDEQQQMCEDNIGLAILAMNKFKEKYNWVDREEIVSDCYWGLVRAVQGYKPDAGKFSTYAMKVMWSTVYRRVNPQYPHFEYQLLDNLEDWYNFIGDKNNQFDNIHNQMFIQQLIKSPVFNKNEKRIMQLMYDDPEITQAEMGRRCGVTGSMIRIRLKQIKGKAKFFQKAM